MLWYAPNILLAKMEIVHHQPQQMLPFSVRLRSSNSFTMASKRLGLTILDGGMGNYLQRTGVPFSGSLWSLTALIDPQYHSNVISAHKSFLRAGCNIITTNTYSCTPQYLSKAGKEHNLESLYACGVELAQIARKEYLAENKEKIYAHQQNNNVLIAASIPPLSESYRSDQLLPEAQCISFYNRIWKALKKTDCDMYIIETMSCLKEAKYCLNALICNGEEQRDIFLFFALREEGLLRDGEDFNDAMLGLNEYLGECNIKMIGFNCCLPEAFEIAMNNLNDTTLSILKENGVFIGCYPNGLSDVPSDCDLEIDGAKEIRSDLSSKLLYRFFKEWIRKYNNDKYRLSLIGGCCAVDPHHLAYVVEQIYKDFPCLISENMGREEYKMRSLKSLNEYKDSVGDMENVEKFYSDYCNIKYNQYLTDLSGHNPTHAF